MAKSAAAPTLLALLCAAPCAWAETAGAGLVPTELYSVLVTATRIEQDAGSALAPATVYDRNAIERLQSRDVTDLLQHVPGADITRGGGRGADSSLFLRGTNSNHTLFLVDGLRVSSATLGSTGFQLLDSEQIERIEIVRGPRSALYGSDAIGGVVQIFTRQPGAEPSAYVRAGYGDHDSYRLAAGGDGRAGQFRYGANVSHYFTEGFSTLKDKQPPNDDRDAYRNNSASVRLGYDFEGGAALDFIHFYTRTKNEYDATFSPTGNQPYGENWIQTSKLTLRAPLTEFWNTTLWAGRAIDDSDILNKLDASNRSDFRTSRNSASWQNDFRIGDQHTVSTGFDYYKEEVTSSNEFTDRDGRPVRNRANRGYFAQYLLDSGPVDLQLGARLDDLDGFGNETTGNAAVGFRLPAQHRLILSYGTAFKAPTFNDLYWPIDPYSFGNPDLKAETSKNYQVEVRGDYSALRWSLSAFQNDIDNLIDWAPVDASQPFSPYTPSNVADARIRGAEFTVDTSVAEWLLAASATYIDPRDTDSDNLLPSRARRSLKVDADRSFGAFSIGASWRAQDRRYADLANTQPLGGYGLIDLRAGYRFSDNWQAQLQLDNILAKDYEVRRGYNVQRFGWFATVTYRL